MSMSRTNQIQWTPPTFTPSTTRWDPPANNINQSSNVIQWDEPIVQLTQPAASVSGTQWSQSSSSTTQWSQPQWSQPAAPVNTTQWTQPSTTQWSQPQWSQPQWSQAPATPDIVPNNTSANTPWFQSQDTPSDADWNPTPPNTFVVSGGPTITPNYITPNYITPNYTVPIAPITPITPIAPKLNPLPMTPDLKRLREHVLHPMLCMEHLGTPGMGEVRGMVTEVNPKSNNFFLRTIEGKDYTMIYNKFLPVRQGDYLHGLVKLVAPYNLELIAHPTVFTPRCGQDIENLIKQRFGKYKFPTTQFMNRLQELANNKNLVGEGVDEEMHPLDTPVDVLDYLAQQHNEKSNVMHLFDKSGIEPKKLKMILEFWNDSIILRRLYLLGFNKRQIRDLHMKPGQLYASIVFNPYTIPGLTMSRCYELDLCTGRIAKVAEARAGEILRAVYANTYKKGWNATSESWLLKRYPDLLEHSDMLQKYYKLVLDEVTHYKDVYTECTEEIQDPNLGFHNYKIDNESEFFQTTTEYPSRREQVIKTRVWYLKKQYLAEKMISLYLQARLGTGPTLDSLSVGDMDEAELLKGKGKSRDSHEIPIVQNGKDNKMEKLNYDREQDRRKSAADFRKQTITHKGPIYRLNISLDEINDQLDVQQKQAVFTAIMGGVSILTGPPGSGKTFCIREICRLLAKYNVPYMLTSFVGKAVSRIREVVCQGVGKSSQVQTTGVGSEENHSNDSGVHPEIEESTETIVGTEETAEVPVASPVWMSDVNHATLHSLIGRQDKPFFRVLIIDESSMLELGLLYDFMSVYGTNYGIIFVGDANQLPPIGPGSLFNEMIKSRAIPKTVLSTYHRLDDGTDDDALLFNLRSMVRWKENQPYIFSTGDNFQILPGESEQVYPLLMYLRYQKNYQKDDISIICPYRKYSDTLNEICQLFWNSEERHVVEPNGKTWYMGDSVMFLTNSKDHGVYNGETGVIVDSEPAGLFSHGEEATRDLTGIKVDFGQGRICILPIATPEGKKQNAYGEAVNSNTGTTYVDENGNTQVHTSDQIVDDDNSDKITTKDIELAYCLTVHKSQGSEYKVVIFIMPLFASAEQKSFINRNMIYTGFSRARAMLIFLGNIMTTTIAVGNKLPYRSEHLADRLLKVLPRIYALEKVEELTKYDDDSTESFDPDDDDMW